MWESGIEKTSRPSKTGVAASPKVSKMTGRRSFSWGQLSIAALATLPGKTAAYPCTGYDDVANQRRSGKRWRSCGVRTNVTPLDYVNEILPSVVGCGFDLVDAVEGDASLKVANPAIEREWWVRIRVNAYNLTSSMETDWSVQCLHDISKSKK
ncbi:hypothetical protein VE02_10200 [Pseudogymnoascus sp. 03VT05]|nr:hypothetical protein VE02_10200 [Pseudogymnoascus sp. 03VT05]